MSRDWKEQVSGHGEISGSHSGVTEKGFWVVTPYKWHVVTDVKEKRGARND
jgi:hypothetical protein